MYEKKIIKKFIKKNYEKMDVRISLLNFNFSLLNFKILVLVKNHMNYLKDNIFQFFYKKYNRVLFFFKNNFFHNI